MSRLEAPNAGAEAVIPFGRFTVRLHREDSSLWLDIEHQAEGYILYSLRLDDNGTDGDSLAIYDPDLKEGWTAWDEKA